MRNRQIKTTFTVERDDDTKNDGEVREYELRIEGTVCAADPSVGMMSQYVEFEGAYDGNEMFHLTPDEELRAEEVLCEALAASIEEDCARAEDTRSDRLETP